MSLSDAPPAPHPSVVDAEARLDGLRARISAVATQAEAQWECDRRGRLRWTSGDALAELGAPIGRFDNGGALAEHFARRAPFRGIDSGLGWRLNGVPFFDHGRFAGYRGTASRGGPQRGEPDLFGTGASADAFAQMTHEVRTPLSAIIGFAQMIEAGTFGAASPAYRDSASAIVDSATRLLDAVDDLASAAQLEQGRYPVGQGAVDVGAVVEAARDRLAPLAARSDVRLQPASAPDLPRAAGDERTLTRALDRLLSALLATATGETLVIGTRAGRGTVELVVSLPTALADLSPEQLLDPSHRVVRADVPTPVLGTGFGLRLGARLIEAGGGRVSFEPGVIRLSIPAIAKPAPNA